MFFFCTAYNQLESICSLKTLKSRLIHCANNATPS